MTVDERIEALTARHEALAQSLEIVAGFQRDADARMEKLVSTVETLTGHMQTLSTIALQHD